MEIKNLIQKIESIGRPVAGGLQSVTLPLILRDDSEGPLVVKDFDVERYHSDESNITIISSRTPEEKAAQSYLFMIALREKGVPVPPVSELVSDDAYDELGLRKSMIIQTDLRQFGRIIDLYESPQVIYQGSNSEELLTGIAFDLAKMHSVGLTIYDDVLTPWVLLDDDSGRLERMVLDTAALHYKSPNYGAECYGNVALTTQLLCRTGDEIKFYESYCESVEHKPLKEAAEKCFQLGEHKK